LTKEKNVVITNHDFFFTVIKKWLQ